MNRDDAIPIISLKQGRFEQLMLTNSKGLNKTLEQKVAWIVHPESGRLIELDQSHQVLHCQQSSPEFVLIALTNTEEARPANSVLSNPPKMQAKTAAIDTGFLAQLEQIILERKRLLPEGSYTTHLFKSGEGKIRKKTGEEAVELILAKDRNEVVNEAADLVYHTMVLLAALDIPISAVIAELARRR